MSSPDRPIPPFAADERSTLEGWLDFHRATLAAKCAGLDEEQLRAASTPPSPISLLGLVRHMAEVERNWFRRILAGEEVGVIYGDGEDGGEGADSGGFTTGEEVPVAEVFATWEAEVARARANAAARALDDTGRFEYGEVSLRWIYVHMIEEYARHNGHADLVRERIDGRTGV
ncbi:putative damage-inducible protein DinB (forms a four-helix bundle) [Streptoalloteichus tenebrarius]|uniref:Damage-inducible protein DinB (Forms a four-helix bundle) n=1 Tax=Streptoalloteichus tenebrarius (strain ATCC 17920 / DSM 40477 / JCM 4838 / CBS 697.72 / NBRC 16177 / NCIMB 11028 / NRRL B-12390 / A12253. 1 / ISP 5477) TaxID=1933 RepID=A0ABT1HXT0_STRSD|nr:DinB family protein [Streptoalloteichus tenebrarius]MCP2260311.1 putative damage-inducible protein DinB (forms a four-helix bundle) [Streptoalloteichus tenebrarius]